jgi:hypothetical protein
MPYGAGGFIERALERARPRPGSRLDVASRWPGEALDVIDDYTVDPTEVPGMMAEGAKRIGQLGAGAVRSAAGYLNEDVDAPSRPEGRAQSPSGEAAKRAGEQATAAAAAEQANQPKPGAPRPRMERALEARNEARNAPAPRQAPRIQQRLVDDNAAKRGLAERQHVPDLSFVSDGSIRDFEANARARSYLDQADAQRGSRIQRAAKEQEEREASALRSRGRSLAYERSLPAGSRSSIQATDPHALGKRGPLAGAQPQMNDYLDGAEDGHAPMGMPTVGEANEAHLKQRLSGQSGDAIKARTEAQRQAARAQALQQLDRLNERLRAGGATPGEIREATDAYLRDAFQRGALNDGDYSALGKYLVETEGGATAQPAGR